MTNEDKHSKEPLTTRDRQTPRHYKPPTTSHDTNHNHPGTSKSQLSTHSNDDITWRLKVNSSRCFERIMADIEGKMVEKIKRQQEINRTVSESTDSATAVTEPPVILLELEEDDDMYNSKDEKAHNNPLRMKAKRAWALIRRHIREQAMNKKQNKSSFQWSMLQQTLKNMTNMDAARGDLYNKYLNPENPRQWAEGIKSIPSGFFARHSKELMRKSAPPIQKIPKAKVSRSAITTTKSVTSRKSYRL